MAHHGVISIPGKVQHLDIRISSNMPSKDTDEAVGNKRVIDALRDGELQKVLDVVRAFGA